MTNEDVGLLSMFCGGVITYFILQPIASWVWLVGIMVFLSSSWLGLLFFTALAGGEDVVQQRTEQANQAAREYQARQHESHHESHHENEERDVESEKSLWELQRDFEFHDPSTWD